MGSFRGKCLIHDYRQIGLGLQQLKHPEMRKYGGFLRWIHSKEIEGDIRMVMESIRLNTDSFMVSLPDGKRIGRLLIQFGIGCIKPANRTRSAPARLSNPERSPR